MIVIKKKDPMDFYASPHEKIPLQKIIAIISIITFVIFFSIASFYNAQLTFAIINTSFVALLGGSIIYSLLIPSTNILPASNEPIKERRARGFSCPGTRRISLVKYYEGDDPQAKSKPSPPHVHFNSPLHPPIPAAGESATPRRSAFLDLRRRMTHHPSSPSLFKKK